LTALDWTIIAVYMGGLIALSVFLGRGQQDEADYYVGGRSLPWWAVGISTMATQTSVISFISIPAFVAVKEGGGLTWLQYELAVPLAMIAVMVVLLPFFRKLELISVYEYLEKRFDRRMRLFISGVFLVSRGLGTGIGVYATALVIQVVTGLDLVVVITMVGVVTIIYDTIGGMKAVVWSDVIQMVVLIAGVFVCIYYATAEAGGLDRVLDFDRSRLTAIEWNAGFSGEETSFWAFLIGGFFLYASYYGADQSQTQRELSAPTIAGTKKSLLLNGLARFPLTCLYLALGVAVAAALAESATLQEAMVGKKADHLIPELVVGVLPSGIRAFIIAAMLAAAMSSLDSALNSLSAATMRDFIHRDREMPGKRVLFLSKLTTVIWGAVITGFAFLVGNVADTVLEAINKIGSAFYGPILATFALGVLSQKVRTNEVLAGVIAGVAVNLSLWIGDAPIQFFWWNAIGFAITWAVATLGSRFTGEPDPEVLRAYTLRHSGLLAEERKWVKTYVILGLMFVAILAVGLWLNGLAS
jgi:SSS family solute:Na+ symporter